MIVGDWLGTGPFSGGGLFDATLAVEVVGCLAPGLVGDGGLLDCVSSDLCSIPWSCRLAIVLASASCSVAIRVRDCIRSSSVISARFSRFLVISVR